MVPVLHVFQRRILTLFLAGFVMFWQVLPGQALTEQQSKTLIQMLVTEINHVSKPEAPKAEYVQEFRRVLAKYSDIGVLARSALGVSWRQATDDQKRRYIEVFGDYLARKYSKTFKDISVSKVTISGTRDVTSGFVVMSVIHLSSGAAYAIDWQVIDIAGEEKLVNLVIEGVSLLSTERTEMSILLDTCRGDLDQFIDKLALHS